MSFSPFSAETNFTHATQDEDHGCRAASSKIGAINRPFVRRQRKMQSTMSTSDENYLSRSFESFGLKGSQSSFSNDIPYSYTPFNYSNHPHTSTSNYTGYRASYNPFGVPVLRMPVEDPSV